MLGRGIIDPVDDVRDTNPPSNPRLLQALAEEFARNGYRLKPLIRAILNSNTYQLASSGGPELSPHAARPERYFIRAQVKMLAAEQILDAVSSATQIPESFKGYPKGTRAIELAEGGINHPFLQAFSKPTRDVACECAREEDPSLPQILHLLNNAGMIEKIKSPKGSASRFFHQTKDLSATIEHLYLATLSRRPTDKERRVVSQHLGSVPSVVEGLQDLQYALINSNEFLLRH